MTFKKRLLVMTITVNVIAITCIYVIVKSNAYNAVSKIENENAKNLLEMAMLSIKNQYTSLKFHREYSYNLRKTERQNIVAIAIASIKKFYNDYQAGKISEATAKKLALQSISEFRYDNGNGYIWINDTERPIPRILIHPIYPEYNNKISSAPIFYTSSDSSNIPLLALDLCQEKGSGFIEYFWTKPSKSEFEGEIPKISYVELFEPWQWILGTGVYLEDIEEDVQNRMDAILTELKQTIGEMKLAETGYFYIFNGKKQILLHPLLNQESGDSILNSLSDIIPYDEVMEASGSPSKTFEYIWNKPTTNENEFIYKKKVIVEYFPPLDWYVCSSLYEEEIEQPGVILGRNILIISAIFLLISIIVSMRLSTSIARPLNNLMKFVSKLSTKKEVDISQIPVAGTQETQELGKVIKGMLLAIEDQKKHLIEAKIRAEESEIKLSTSEKKFRTLYESSNDAIFLIEGNIVIDCNQKTLELFKCGKDFIIGNSPTNFSPEYQPDGIKSIEKEKEILSDVLEGNSHFFEWRHIRPNGEFFDAFASLNLIDLGDIKYVQAVLRDITEKKRTEKELEEYKNNLERLVEERTLELRETQTQLVQSEKMASLGILTAGVAHEINNPLNFIMGASSGLEVVLGEDELAENPRINVMLRSVKEGVERISTIVKGLNQFSRSKENYDEECNINTILDNCLTILHSEYKNRITIKKGYIKDIPSIKGNVGKLHQAFINIFQNSIHAITKKGTISINTSVANNNLLIEIFDTGMGISQNDLHKITDPFFTTKAPGKGTGLGLSITYSIIKEHDGEIEFTSQENKGTSVKITLPIYK